MNQVRAFGEDALSVRLEGPDATRLAIALCERILALRDTNVRDVTSGASSVLVELDGPASDRLIRELERPVASGSVPDGRIFEVPVVYDGEDLIEVSQLTGLSVAETVRMHSDPTYTVAFCGFSPGFPYLLGTPDPLASVPRRDSPRPRVAAGSVAVASGWSGIYPSATPGGWRILGSTDLELFSTDRDPPALLAPGDRVRMVPQ